jgi:hypothetical protein
MIGFGGSHSTVGVAARMVGFGGSHTGSRK